MLARGHNRNGFRLNDHNAQRIGDNAAGLAYSSPVSCAFVLDLDDWVVGVKASRDDCLDNHVSRHGKHKQPDRQPTTQKHFAELPHFVEMPFLRIS
jgi:hypothetical protein